MYDNAIIINGKVYALVDAVGEQDCVDCAIYEQCKDVMGNTICGIIHNIGIEDKIYAERDFKDLKAL